MGMGEKIAATYDVGRLKAKTTEIAERAGVPAADAAMIADVLVLGVARGISSPGLWSGVRPW